MKPNGVLEVDVLVFGGGPAGAATALALGRRGLSAALVDRSDSTKDRIGETLPPAIRPLLSKLGVWERFSRDGHMASGGVHSSWGRADLHINDFIVNPHGLGWHVDRALFDSMLAREAERIGAVVLRKSTIRPDIARTPCGWECQLTVGGNTQTIRAQFVVDATGRSSGFARGQGAQRLAGDHLIGIIGFLSSCSKGISHDSFTFVESVENGWWYSAPLPNGRAVAAYMTDADLFAGEAGRRSSFWSKQLNRTKHIRTRLKDFRLSSPPLVRCANSAKLARPAGVRWLAVGDAALSFDPLSSQGVYKALESALRAADMLGADGLESTSALRDYEDWVHRQYEQYGQTSAKYYALEMRWPNSPFWQRRHNGGWSKLRQPSAESGPLGGGLVASPRGSRK